PSRHGQPDRLLTCCFCGARSILPGGTGAAARLVCHGCGAPIKAIEVLSRPQDRPRKGRKQKGPAIPHPAERPHDHLAKDRPVRRKRGKRRDPSWSRFVSKMWDELEDAVEDIFD
ncbi:MAG: hypothetical protein AAFT19_06500, partial [Pseudomonadota bacterium]